MYERLKSMAKQDKKTQGYLQKVPIVFIHKEMLDFPIHDCRSETLLIVVSVIFRLFV